MRAHLHGGLGVLRRCLDLAFVLRRFLLVGRSTVELSSRLALGVEIALLGVRKSGLLGGLEGEGLARRLYLEIESSAHLRDDHGWSFGGSWNFFCGNDSAGLGRGSDSGLGGSHRLRD